MAVDRIASVNLSWDEYGNVSHDLTTFIPANDYQRQDAIALCSPLVLSSQLGVLAPKYGLELVSDTLNYLTGGPRSIHRIQYPLARARIDLHQKAGTMVCTFHPEILDGGTMEVEEAVRRLLNNYIWHVQADVILELSDYMRDILLVVILFYLETALSPAIEQQPFRVNAINYKVQADMLDFQPTIFPKWGGRVPEANFNSLLKEALREYKAINSRLSPET